MPAEDIETRNSAAPMVLLWSAVGLAPVAAALLVIGSEGTLLRAGGVLAMLAVILVAVGSMLARSGRAGGGVEGYVADEIETLRTDLRADITHAAKATHRVLSEKIMALTDTVEALRGQIEVLRTHVERSHLTAPASAAPVSAGVGAASVPGGVSGGVFRHTETVQVTTRQTTYDADRGTAGYGSAAVPGQRRADRTGEPSGYQSQPAPSWQGTYQGRARAEDRPSADTTSGYSATAGYASVPGQEARAGRRSREMHLGERSAELRMDGSGTEMRVQDRWASMVQTPDEPTTSGGHRRHEGDDTAYWTRVGSETTQPVRHRYRESDESTTDWRMRAAQPAVQPAQPALSNVQSGEPAPAWSTSQELPRRVPTAGTYRGTEYGRSGSWNGFDDTNGGHRSRHGQRAEWR
jgi:hypothetical protein